MSSDAPISKRQLKKSLRTTFTPTWRDRAGRAKLRARQTANLPFLLAGARLHRPVFIIGAPRSGTSLLYAILRSSSRLAHWPGEAHEVWEADFHPALRGWSSNVLTAADATPREAERIRRKFFLVTGPRHRLIEKSPRNSLRLGFVDHIFPDARYVFLERDGRDNVNSLINAWRTSRYRTYRLPRPHSIPGVDPNWWKFVLYPGWKEDATGPLEVVCAKQWIASNRYALDGLAQIGDTRCVRVRYEELIEDPVGYVAQVMDFLELPFEEAVRAKAAAARTTPVNIVTPPERGKWRRENPREIQGVLGLIEPIMKELGYDIDED
jgi:hypothetical protein